MDFFLSRLELLEFISNLETFTLQEPDVWSTFIGKLYLPKNDGNKARNYFGRYGQKRGQDKTRLTVDRCSVSKTQQRCVRWARGNSCFW